MNLAFVGPSGVGLGTQVSLLVEKKGMIPFSTGDVLRTNLAQGTALGILVRNYMAQGELVPDEIVDAMVEEWLRKSVPQNARVVFDGFPRTLDQAQFLDDVLRKLGRRLDWVILLEAPDDVIIQRLAGRLICPGCNRTFHKSFKPPTRPGVCDACGKTLVSHPDDQPSVAQVRLRNFHRMILPVLDYYRSTNRVIALNARGSAAAISADVLEALQNPERRTVSIPAPSQTARTTTTTSRVGEEPLRLDLVLLGGPGSGKGTQAKRVHIQFQIPHISTGELFREHLKQNTKLGLVAKTFMDRGDLVPDNVTDSMVDERLSMEDTDSGFILDGFPRTLQQAYALDEMLYERGRLLVGVVYVEVPDQDIIERLGGRIICRNCQTPYHKTFKAPVTDGVCDVCGGELYQRFDDNPEAVANRLRAFHRQTEPLMNYYRADGLLRVVNGKGSVEEVTERIVGVVNHLRTATNGKLSRARKET